MKYRIILVHGTFAKNAPWTRQDSQFCQKLRARIQNEVVFESFNWSGENSHFSRIEAADELLNVLNSHVSNTYEQKIIIAHSHGGNIALYALGKMGEQAAEFHLVTMATPFLNVSKRDYQILIKVLAVIISLTLALLLVISLGFALTFFPKSLVLMSGLLAFLCCYFLFPKLSRILKRKNSELDAKVDNLVSQLSISDNVNSKEMLVVIDERDEISFWFTLLLKIWNTIDSVQFVIFIIALVTLGYGILNFIKDLISNLFSAQHSFHHVIEVLTVDVAVVFSFALVCASILLVTVIINTILYIPLRSNMAILGNETWLHRVFIKIKPSIIPDKYIKYTSIIKHRSGLFNHSLKHSIYNQDGVISYIVAWIERYKTKNKLVFNKPCDDKKIEDMFLICIAAGINPKYFFLDIGLLSISEAEILIQKINSHRNYEIANIHLSKAFKILEEFVALLIVHNSKDTAILVYKKICHYSLNEATQAINEVMLKYSIDTKKEKKSIYKRRQQKKIRAYKLVIPISFFIFSTYFLFRLWFSKSLFISWEFEDSLINRLSIERIFVWNTLSLIDVLLLCNVSKLFVTLYAFFSGRNIIPFTDKELSFADLIVLAIILECFVFGKTVGFAPEKLYWQFALILFILPGVILSFFFERAE